MQPVLITPRLELRPVQISSVQLVHSLWTNRDVRYFLFDDRVISLDEARSLVEASLRSFEERGYGLWLAFSREVGYDADSPCGRRWQAASLLRAAP